MKREREEIGKRMGDGEVGEVRGGIEKDLRKGVKRKGSR